MVALELGVEFCYAERVVPAGAGEAEALFPVEYVVPQVVRPKLRGKRVAIVNDVISAGSAVRGTLADLTACDADTGRDWRPRDAGTGGGRARGGPRSSRSRAWPRSPSRCGRPASVRCAVREWRWRVRRRARCEAVAALGSGHPRRRLDARRRRLSEPRSRLGALRAPRNGAGGAAGLALDCAGMEWRLGQPGAFSRTSRRHPAAVGDPHSRRLSPAAGRLRRQPRLSGRGHPADPARRSRRAAAARSTGARVDSAAHAGRLRLPHPRQPGTSALHVLPRDPLCDASHPRARRVDGAVHRRLLLSRAGQGRVRDVRPGECRALDRRRAGAGARVEPARLGRAGGNGRGRSGDGGWLRGDLRPHDRRIVHRVLSLDPARTVDGALGSAPRAACGDQRRLVSRTAGVVRGAVDPVRARRRRAGMAARRDPGIPGDSARAGRDLGGTGRRRLHRRPEPCERAGRTVHLPAVFHCRGDRRRGGDSRFGRLPPGRGSRRPGTTGCRWRRGSPCSS